MGAGSGRGLHCFSLQEAQEQWDVSLLLCFTRVLRYHKSTAHHRVDVAASAQRYVKTRDSGLGAEADHVFFMSRAVWQFSGAMGGYWEKASKKNCGHHPLAMEELAELAEGHFPKNHLPPCLLPFKCHFPKPFAVLLTWSLFRAWLCKFLSILSSHWLAPAGSGPYNLPTCRQPWKLNSCGFMKRKSGEFFAGRILALDKPGNSSCSAFAFIFLKRHGIMW